MSKVLILTPFFLCVIFAFFVPFISSYDVNFTDLNSVKLEPSAVHLFGTDFLGRDFFTRCAYALRNSLFIAFCSSFLMIVFAISYALLMRSFLRHFFLSLLDAFLAFPSLLFMMFFQSFFKHSFLLMIIIIALRHFAIVAKLLDTEISKFKEKDFYKNAVVLGNTKMQILLYDVLPACVNLLLILFVLNIAHAISAEAVLSFFGLGLELNQASLGILLSEASRALFVGAWWLVILPVILLLSLSFPLILFAQLLQDKFGIKI